MKHIKMYGTFSFHQRQKNKTKLWPVNTRSPSMARKLSRWLASNTKDHYKLSLDQWCPLFRRPSSKGSMLSSNWRKFLPHIPLVLFSLKKHHSFHFLCIVPFLLCNDNILHWHHIHSDRHEPQSHQKLKCTSHHHYTHTHPQNQHIPLHN